MWTGLAIAAAACGSDIDPTPTGSLPLDVQRAPVITNITAVPARLVAVGDSASLDVNANDPDVDGGALSFAWSVNGCGGRFSSVSAKNPTFTLEAPSPSATCTLVVVVTDASRLKRTGELTIRTGAVTVTDETPADAGVDAATNLPPIVDLTVASDTAPSGGADVVFRIYAHDPDARGALRFAWSFTGGTKVAQRDAVESSELVWRTPACPTTTTVVSATVTDADGVVAREDFTTVTVCP